MYYISGKAKKREFEKVNRIEKIGSPGRTRTANLLVTSAPGFLPGLDYLFTRPASIAGEGVGRFPHPAREKPPGGTEYEPKL